LTATILFTDLKNFSTIAEKQSSESLMIWLNEYLSTMTDIVLKHQGIVSKFTGDGLMAVFGVPVPRTTLDAIANDAKNAINSALEMGQCLQKLNEQWQKKGLPSVGMRVGIYTGTVTVGSLGGKNRLEYGLIGDSVNIASRLESCEKH
ncbi:adenylate/guanylate cyclase domain-containing protein, partial [Planktothrix sp.]|uniref:adenylate/guanylate cyclase domain-containing protein n=2 Tax=Planktothrix sp. TaxID=3088171 RepID=UPI0038D395E7